MEDIKPQVRGFLKQFFRNYDLSDDTDIFASGHVNSLAAMELVLFVEQTFQITVENDDLSMENFNTIDAITEFIKQKTACQVVA
jgi:methoxymalonate biosynthesis acyl carrier protein